MIRSEYIVEVGCIIFELHIVAAPVCSGAEDVVHQVIWIVDEIAVILLIVGIIAKLWPKGIDSDVAVSALPFLYIYQWVLVDLKACTQSYALEVNAYV